MAHPSASSEIFAFSKETTNNCKQPVREHQNCKLKSTLMIWRAFLVVTWLFFGAIASRHYNELLVLKPLPRNRLISSFEFEVNSLGVIGDDSGKDHYEYFPRALGPIVESTSTRELHLRFTQGWWDSESWGSMPYNGTRSGGTGVELWAIIEALTLKEAKEQWFKLSQTLSGFFCASLNFIDDSITTLPKAATTYLNDLFKVGSDTKLFLLRAALPNEPICTENLTPFLKLLPTRGKAGISSLLDGHKLFDSLWYGMSIDLTTKCQGNDCHLNMIQTINAVVDVQRSLRREKLGGIPKPIPGDELKCDPTKDNNAWKCFPLNDQNDISWKLSSIYGTKIKGPAFIDDEEESTKLQIDIDSNNWGVQFLQGNDDDEVVYKYDQIKAVLKDDVDIDFQFSTENSSAVYPIDKPPLSVSRSLTGFSQDQGGLRATFFNPSSTESVDFVYTESLPWFMRLYLYTLKTQFQNSTGTYDDYGFEFIKNTYYKPAIDRKRPSQFELSITLPPLLTLTLNYQFQKSLLLYHEYPPDANHGFAIEPALVYVLNNEGKPKFELRTTSLLLTLPTPDFSMPYNVIILTCTVMALAFGSIYNLLTKKVVTELELEALNKDGKLTILIGRIKSKIQRLKGRS